MRWKKAIGRLALLAASLVVALAAAEVAVRVAGIGSDQLLEPDPVLGLRHIPDKHGLSQAECYRARVTINHEGWRSPEVPLAKPAGTYRIVVLGDSFMDALQVGDDETFAQRLGALVEPRVGRPVEVVNLGCASYGTDQELLALRHEGLRYDPDLVVLAFYAQNDVRNNVRALERQISAYPKPFFHLEGERLVAEPFRDETPRWVRWAQSAVAPLRLYPLLRDAIYDSALVHRLLYRIGVIRVVPSAVEHQVGGDLPRRWRHQLDVFEQPLDPRYDEAWKLAAALVTAARDDASAHGARFLLVGIADPISVLPPELLTRDQLGVDPERLDLDAPQRRLGEIAAQRGIDFVSLVPAFRERIGHSTAAWDGLYLHCNGHWTAAGHRLAADVVAEHLESAGDPGAASAPAAQR